LIGLLSTNIVKFKSKRLKGLLQYKKTSSSSQIHGHGELPDIDVALASFEALVIWIPSGNGMTCPEPVKGVDENYDLAKLKVSQVQKQLTKILHRYRE
jgi:hypothetical protein